MLKTLILKWAEFVVNQRVLVILFTLLLAFGSLHPIVKNAYFDNSNELFFLPDDPNLKKYDLLLDRFGDNEYLSVGIEARDSDKNVFNYDTLQMIAKITEFLEDHEAVTKVSSITKYQYIHSEDDALQVDDLIEDMEDLDNTQESMDQLAAIMEKETLVHGALVTADMQHTVIVARTEYIKRENDHKVKLIDELNAFIKDQQFKELGFDLHIFGQALLAERFLHLTMGDQSLIVPLLSLVIVVLLFLSFRTVTGVLMPWMVIFCSILMVLGFQFLLEWPFNMINTMLPNIIIIITIGVSVHLITEFYHFRNTGLDPEAAAKKAVEVLWLPCFYTSLTTSIGFLALSVTKLAPVKEFGVLGAAGAVVSFLLSVSLLPAVLSFIRSFPKGAQFAVTEGWVSRVTARLSPFTYQYRIPITVIGGGLIVFSVIFSSQLSVDANFISYFKQNSKVRQDFNYFDRTYGGGLNLEFMLDSGKEGGVKEPEFLREALRFQDYLENMEVTGQANSVLDYIRKQNQSMHNDDPAFFRIPESRELVAQYLLLYENTGPEEDLSDLKTFDERVMRISLRVVNMSDMAMAKWMDGIRETLKKDFPTLKMELTGTIALFNAQQVYMQDGMIRSFSIAVMIIILCFFVLFRSFKFGLLAMIPSIFPILFTGGIMFLMGVTLDLGTILIAAMTIGIAVDDSIHVMNRYVQARRSGKSQQESVHLAMIESGRAVIFTSIILIGGFSMFMLASFVSFIYLGLFSAIIMLVALLADLLFLPAIIFVTGKSSEAAESPSTLIVEGKAKTVRS
ncbi:MAG: MMPL family transporter [SAR324 cluster bacterium]|nr:MMPL family transporter [SAR324 cluster bacterium]